MAQMLCGNWAISDTAAFGAASEHRRHHSTDVVMNWIILNLSLSTERLILFAILNFVEWHLLRAKNDVFAHCLWMANYFCRTISVRSEKSEFNPRVFFSNSVFLLLFMRTQTKYSANKLLIQNNKTSRDYVTIEHLPFLFHPQIESIWVGSNWFMATLWIIHWIKMTLTRETKTEKKKKNHKKQLSLCLVLLQEISSLSHSTRKIYIYNAFELNADAYAYSKLRKSQNFQTHTRTHTVYYSNDVYQQQQQLIIFISVQIHVLYVLFELIHAFGNL